MQDKKSSRIPYAHHGVDIDMMGQIVDQKVNFLPMWIAVGLVGLLSIASSAVGGVALGRTYHDHADLGNRTVGSR